MRNAEQARQAALAFFADWKLEVQLIDDRTELFEAGWVFWYQSAKFLLTGDFKYALAGNAPIFVPRNGAPPQAISYHRPTQESIDAFNVCGDACAVPNAEVEISGRQEGAMHLEAVRALREASNLGLAEIKRAIDQCSLSQPFRVQAQSVASARGLAARLVSLRFDAKITYSLPLKP